MAEILLAVLPSLVTILGTLAQFWTSSAHQAKREVKANEDTINDFNKALAKNNAETYTGMCLAQHDRVRTLLSNS